MAKQSSVNLDITNNPDGFDISGGTVVRKLGITGGDVTIAGSGSAVITFPTTSTTIAGLSITQSFSALQSFSSGLSAAGGVTLSSNVTIPSGSTFTVNGNFIANGNVNLGDAITDAITVTGLLAANGGLSAAGGTFSGTQTFINGATFQGNITAPNIVTSFNGLTGSVTGVTTGIVNTFVALQSFTTGISASGGVTFAGTLQGTTSNFTGLVSSTVGFSGPGTNITGVVTSFNNQTGAVSGVGSFNGNTGAVQGVSSWNGQTGAVSFTNYVSSFNGLTGDVTGVTTGTTNTFVALQSFTTGISASGGVTLSGTLKGSTATFTGDFNAVGGTFSGQLNAQNLKVLTVGGNEGGQLDFGLAATGNSLTGGIAIDVYQNKLRFFETGGNNKGAYIDLTATASSVGTNLLSLSSGQSFIGSNVNLSTSTWTDITSLSLASGTWMVSVTATFGRGSGTTARTFSLQITDGITTYASASHGMAGVQGNATQVSCNSIITLTNTTTIKMQGTTTVTSSPVDYASATDVIMGVSSATGLIAVRIGS